MVAVKTRLTEKFTLQDKNDPQVDVLSIPYPLECEPPKLTPREFCRRMFGLSKLSEVEILCIEMQRGYRKKCIRLLCQTLNVKRQTVLNWGGDLDFNGMPATYRRFLGMCWERYELLLEVRRLRTFTG
jgi:hypothetical protein